MAKEINLVGKKFGMLKVLGRSPLRDNNGKVKWRCLCDCGMKSDPLGGDLRSGKTRSCGCRRGGVGRPCKHGMVNTRIYRIWAGMKARCYNKNVRAFKNYGARGISVCDSWLNSFETFFKDMGLPPTNKHQIDRIDNDGNYEPKNCRWTTCEIQNGNRRSVILVSVEGQRVCLAAACRVVGQSYAAAHNRIMVGRSPEEALYLPAMRGIKRRSERNGL